MAAKVSKVAGINDYFSSELQIVEAEEKLVEAERKVQLQQELIQQLQAERKATDDKLSTSTAAIFIPIEKVVREPDQVRRYFDAQKLANLTESVKQIGIIEPLWVRPLPDGSYKLVAGERRYRAATTAGLTEVPVVVRELSDSEALEISLVENLQRDDLNPVEETDGILQLLSIRLELTVSKAIAILYKMKNEQEGRVRENVFPNQEDRTIEEIFSALGRMTWQSFISSRLPLRNLPEDIKEVLRQGKLDYTKARVIARVKNEQERQNLLQEVLRQNLSLTQIRERIGSIPTSIKQEQSNLRCRSKEIHQRLHKAKLWDDVKKCKRLEKLLTQIEILLNEE